VCVFVLYSSLQLPLKHEKGYTLLIKKQKDENLYKKEKISNRNATE